MKVVIQRVLSADLVIDGDIYSKISQGMVILLGISQDDDMSHVTWLVQKIVNLRIFNDEEGKMNLSLADIDGDVMVVSQFTLFASTKKGQRPSYIRAARPEKAIPLYESFVKSIQSFHQKDVKTGVFGADMKLTLTNDGPVTIFIDTSNKE